jgi:hypothetical protein
MRSEPFAAVALLAWFLATPAVGQHANGWTREVIQARMAKAATLPMERRTLEVGTVYSNYFLDQAWDISTEGNGHATQKPKVKFALEGESMLVDNGDIILPIPFLMSMTALAVIVGHDAAFDDDLEHVTAPGMLGQPIGNLQLLREYGNTGLFGEDANNTFMFVQYLNCARSGGECASSQTAAQICGFVFVFGHELSRVLSNQHMPDDGAYPIDDELEADKNGLRVLRRFIERSDADDPIVQSDASRHACLAMPAAFLEVNERGMRSSLKDSFARRKEAYLAALGDDRDAVEDLTKLQESTSGIGTLHIAPLPDDSLIVVDGVQVAHDDAASLQLITGVHTVSVASADGFASSKVTIRGGMPAPYKPDFTPFNPSSGAKLSTDVSRRSWAEVVAETADMRLRPIDAASSPALWKALHELKLDAWIVPAPGQELSREARRWQTRALTGATWSDAFLDSVLADK